MGREFTFYDYVNGSGVNIINDWLNGAGKEAKAKFNSIIRWLGESPPAASQDSLWKRPYIWPLHEKWKGFKEIRSNVKGVEYRLICKIEERNVFLVTWGYHKGKWQTDITVQKANERVDKMKNKLIKYGREHVYR